MIGAMIAGPFIIPGPDEIIWAKLSRETGATRSVIISRFVDNATDITKSSKTTQTIFKNSRGLETVTVTKVHGNSKNSVNAQHGYEIFNQETGEVVKTGVSGGKMTKSGDSYRANRQVNKWNKKEGEGKYAARVVYQNGGGTGARRKALEWEAKNAEFWRNEGHLTDPKKHSRP